MSGTGSGGLRAILPWLPVIVVGAGVVASASVADWRIDAQAEEIEKIEEGADELEDEVEAIQRLLIQRQGKVELDLQRIENAQKAQGEDLEEMLLILRDLQEGRP